MNEIPITLACGPYDRTEGLRDGSIRAEGVRLTYISLTPEEIFWRMLKFREFDASEMSMCNHIMATARGTSPFVAIPVFPSRMFRHGCLFVHAHGGIQAPADLIGKRMGAPEYHMTALLWIRGMLQHEYNVRPQDMHWVLAGLETPGRRDRIEFTMPAGLSWESHPDRVLSDMLERGEVDAVMTARAPSCFLRGSPRVTRLFEDYLSVEQDYYLRTRLFPIMHTLVVRKDLDEQHPWLAQSLFKACLRAKERAAEQMWDTDALRYMIPWLLPTLQQHGAVFGEDWWPYGIEANRHVVETMVQYALEQGLIGRPVDVAELFAPSTFSTFKV